MDGLKQRDEHPNPRDTRVLILLAVFSIFYTSQSTGCCPLSLGNMTWMSRSTSHFKARLHHCFYFFLSVAMSLEPWHSECLALALAANCPSFIQVFVLATLSPFFYSLTLDSILSLYVFLIFHTCYLKFFTFYWWHCLPICVPSYTMSSWIVGCYIFIYFLFP